MTDVKLEMDLADAQRLHRLVTLGRDHDAVDPANDAVAAYIAFSVAQAAHAAAKEDA